MASSIEVAGIVSADAVVEASNSLSEVSSLTFFFDFAHFLVKLLGDLFGPNPAAYEPAEIVNTPFCDGDDSYKRSHFVGLFKFVSSEKSPVKVKVKLGISISAIVVRAESNVLDENAYTRAMRIYDTQSLILTRFEGAHSYCLTQNPRICGIQNEAKLCDVIGAFEGADRLYALRPAGNQLIGYAHVHGLMQGEAYRKLDLYEVDYDTELI